MATKAQLHELARIIGRLEHWQNKYREPQRNSKSEYDIVKAKDLLMVALSKLEGEHGNVSET
jgi:hypothetical protein